MFIIKISRVARAIRTCLTPRCSAASSHMNSAICSSAQTPIPPLDSCSRVGILTLFAPPPYLLSFSRPLNLPRSARAFRLRAHRRRLRLSSSASPLASRLLACPAIHLSGYPVNRDLERVTLLVRHLCLLFELA